MNTQNKAAIESVQLSIKQTEDLKLYRRLLILTLLLYPVFGYVNTFVHQPATESLAMFYQRICFSLIVTICVASSYYFHEVRRRFYTIILTLVYIGFSHLTYIALVNGYTMNHLVGIVMVYVGTSLVFRKNLHLNLYIIFACLVTILVAFISPLGDISRIIVTLIFISISIVIFIGMNMKIRAEIRLKHNEANFTAITENTNDLIWSIDLNYKLLSANTAALTLFKIQGMKGISIGKKIDLLIITSKIKEDWEDYYQRALRGEIFSIIQLEENTAQTYEHSFYPIKSSKGFIQGTCVFSRNISEQINRENRLKEAQKIAKTGSFTRNFVSGKYIWSDYMFELFQLPKYTDITSLDMKKMIHPEDYEEYEKIYETVNNTRESLSIRYRIVRSNFTIVPVLSNIVFKHDDEKNLIEVSGTIQDYSEQYRTDQLERNNLELQKEKELAEILNKQHETFLAKMSHEIRTPMNSIVGITNLLAKVVFENQKHNEYVHAIKQNSDKLLNIINDVLDYSNLEQEGIDIKNEIYSVSTLFNSLIDSYQHEANQRSISMRFFIEPDVNEQQRGDVTYISRVLANLISNSIKFTQDGEIIIAACIEQQADASFLIFKVIDTGVGISDDKKNKIFDTFVQLDDNELVKNSGTGLGLPICKKIVDLLGGKISVNNWTGLGSEFIVSLPLLDHEHTQTISSQLTDTAHISILLVEDNTFNQMVAIETLESWNPNVQISLAENGEEALKQLQEQVFDIILMDIQMPIMDGHEASKRIRSEFSEPTRSIPILAVTAHAFKEEIQKCYENGMNDYISKPFDGDVLIQKIKKLVNVNSEKQTETSNHSQEKITIDFQSIEEFTKGKKERIKKMVTMFLHDTPLELERLKTLIIEQNYPAIQTLAHSFKPKYNYMGMSELSEVAKKIEYLAKEEGDISEINRLFNFLDRQSTLAYIELEKYIG